MIFICSVIVIINLTISFVSGELTAVVNTTTGPVQGEVLSTVWHSVKYASFKGIKYGEAPIGYFRFKPPVPVIPWTEILNATVAATECVQIDSKTNAVTGSEDCLFLNVFTPVTNLEETPKSLKAVMVWIYGGAWISGSSASGQFSPDFLLERDVVIVSLNYRLGAFGFLSLNHTNATGNAGLKDQNLALKWVQSNIENFGGNPRNVTIFGQSAGAVSVGFHTISDASAGLFHGAISMSGSPLVSWGFQTPETAQSRAEQLGSSIGANSTDKEILLEAFYKISAAELAEATSDELPLYFTPTIETASIATDVFISECSINKYYSGNFNKVPQLIGFMEDETVDFVGAVKIFTRIVDEAIHVLDDIGMSIPSFLESVTNSLADDVASLGNDTVYALVDETTEILFMSPIDKTQRILAEYNGDNPVYYYQNSFYTDRNRHNIVYNTSFLGAGHTDDVAEIFYAPFMNYDLNVDDPITRTIYRITTMWTNFAKYGDPTPGWVDEYPLNITWPVSGEDGSAMYIGNDLKIGPRPINANVKIIQLLSAPFLKKRNGCPTSTISDILHEI